MASPTDSSKTEPKALLKKEQKDRALFERLVRLQVPMLPAAGPNPSQSGREDQPQAHGNGSFGL